MAKFAFSDEVLALLLTDDAAAKQLAPLLKDYEFAKQEQGEVADALLSFTHEWQAAAKEHAYTVIKQDHHPYLTQLKELAGGVHRDYVTARLEAFLREGLVRKTVSRALDHMQMGEWDDIEKLFTSFTRQKSSYFNPGVRLRGEVLKELLKEDINELVYKTGIKALDAAYVGPAPKTLLVFVAPPKRGKSWYLINQGVTSLRSRLSVNHVTLEMNTKQVSRRYIQNLLSLTKRQADELDVTRLAVDEFGRLREFQFEKIKRPHLDRSVYDKANALLERFKFYVKEFPTRSIGVEDLRAYLDQMEEAEHFVPDVLIVDYADLMRVDAANLRVDTGVLYQELRGVAMERGMALVTASQSNRSSANAQWVREDMVAEDWSKIMTADTVLTYSQTPDERKLGLARLFVSNARDETDKWAVVISQAYAIGQFALDSVRLPDDTYWKMVNEVYGRTETDND